MKQLIAARGARRAKQEKCHMKHPVRTFAFVVAGLLTVGCSERDAVQPDTSPQGVEGGTVVTTLNCTGNVAARTLSCSPSELTPSGLKLAVIVGGQNGNVKITTSAPAYDAGTSHFTFGTTLQVPRDMWPADRAAFQEYWEEQTERVVIDETIRNFLMGLVMLVNVAWPLRVFAPIHRWFVTAFLPPVFREQMHLAWTEKDQRRFERIMRGIGWVSRKLPRRIRNWPIYLNLWDLRRRVRRGRPLV